MLTCDYYLFRIILNAMLTITRNPASSMISKYFCSRITINSPIIIHKPWDTPIILNISTQFVIRSKITSNYYRAANKLNIISFVLRYWRASYSIWPYTNCAFKCHSRKKISIRCIIRIPNLITISYFFECINFSRS